MAGFTTITIPSAADGGVDLDAFRAALGPRTAAVMITNPSTARPVRGADRRAARRRPRGRRAGLHGRRQPQRHHGPLQARRGRLRRDALQRPQDVHHAARRRRSGRRAGRGGGDARCRSCPRRASCASRTAGSASSGRASDRRSIGRVRSFVGNTGVLVRAYAYIRAHGGPGLREVSDDAVLAANYLKHRLAGRLRHPVRPAVQARVRRFGRDPQERRPASARSTSPSG